MTTLKTALDNVKQHGIDAEIMKVCITVPITGLVSFLCKSGDIESRFKDGDSNSGSASQRGIAGHQYVRELSEADNDHEVHHYESEVPVKLIVPGDEFDMELSGRIDGVIHSSNGTVIEEIKTTTAPLQDLIANPRDSDMAQAKCYAHMYGLNHSLSALSVKITYYQRDTHEIASVVEYYSKTRLASFFFELIDEYRVWLRRQYRWEIERNQSIGSLRFPFSHYRNGQSELIISVEDIIHSGMKMFVQAPTGIGKTMAVLFPAIKALGKGEIRKIFYLTAKTVARTVAEKTTEILRAHGLKLKTITLTAKEKICFHPLRNESMISSERGSSLRETKKGAGTESRSRFSCEPQMCEYAQGYYDRIKDALSDIFDLQIITREVIERYAQRHRVCPFEYALDISLWCDEIICDYNYAFDPGVYLRRFFNDNSNDYAFLVDEAHNLVDRAREMFSAQLSKGSIHSLKRATSKLIPKVSKRLKVLDDLLVEQIKLCDEELTAQRVEKAPPEWIWSPLKDFVDCTESMLATGEEYTFKEDLISLFFDAIAFLSVMNLFDDCYITYVDTSRNDQIIKLFCVDPSRVLRQALTRCKAAVFFSATLTPLEYFVYVLGGDEKSIQLRLPSPFPRENLHVTLDSSVSTKYRLRDFSLVHISLSIAELVKGKPGNYIAYFPSYEYMNKVRELFSNSYGDIEIVRQRSGMSESEREEFLSLFSHQRNEALLGFAVMGGIFGEAIDLSGDRLSGVIIVGVGLPAISLEREIIREYYSELKELGYEYAYVFPGLIRVLQAAGRVIRTETDRGVIVLIDDRFATPLYRDLLPPEWQPIPQFEEHIELESSIKKFWMQCEESNSGTHALTCE